MVRVVVALSLGVPLALLLGFAARPLPIPTAGEPDVANATPPAAAPAETNKPAVTPPRTGGHGAAGDVDPATRPAAEHDKLMKLAGRYTTVSRLSIPGAEIVETRGEAILTPILGGRFLMIEEAGSLAGTPFEARKLLGYNTGARQYESVWTYTASTAMLILRGASNDGGRTIRLTGNVNGPESERGPYVITFSAPDDAAFTVMLKQDPGDGGGGSPGPEMITTYTRRK